MRQSYFDDAHVVGANIGNGLWVVHQVKQTEVRELPPLLVLHVGFDTALGEEGLAVGAR